MAIKRFGEAVSVLRSCMSSILSASAKYSELEDKIYQFIDMGVDILSNNTQYMYKVRINIKWLIYQIDIKDYSTKDKIAEKKTISETNITNINKIDVFANNNKIRKDTLIDYLNTLYYTEAWINKSKIDNIVKVCVENEKYIHFINMRKILRQIISCIKNKQDYYKKIEEMINIKNIIEGNSAIFYFITYTYIVYKLMSRNKKMKNILYNFMNRDDIIFTLFFESDPIRTIEMIKNIVSYESIMNKIAEYRIAIKNDNIFYEVLKNYFEFICNFTLFSSIEYMPNYYLVSGVYADIAKKIIDIPENRKIKHETLEELRVINSLEDLYLRFKKLV